MLFHVKFTISFINNMTILIQYQSAQPKLRSYAGTYWGVVYQESSYITIFLLYYELLWIVEFFINLIVKNNQ